jgi:hypothetical protein
MSRPCLRYGSEARNRLESIQALYGHYEKTHKLWQDGGIKVPPCFTMVCQNTGRYVISPFRSARREGASLRLSDAEGV